MSGDSLKIRVGSRKSELALIQTRHVISLLKNLNPDMDFEIVTMNTLGDKILDKPLPKIGEKSLFTKELETALETGDVDFVVHSLKDLPTCLPKGMAIGAVLTREDPRDALVLKKDLKDLNLSTLPKDSVIGTSSLRRTAQLARKYPHLKVENIRGNLNTRLKKLDDLGIYQAIILAAAGLIRIGWKQRISKLLEMDELMYAVGQGALAVECREDNENILQLLEPLYDLQTALRVIAERSFLKTLGGGCSAPVAVSSSLSLNAKKEVELILKGAVWSLDGLQEIKDEESIIIEVSNGLRCAICPYNTNSFSVAVEDIECCVKCPNQQTLEPLQKRQKIEIPSEILRQDPHEKCPIQLPVGSEFMGACPYLEGELGSIQGLENMLETTSNSEPKTCPFFKKINDPTTEVDSSNPIETNKLTDIAKNIAQNEIDAENSNLQNIETDKLYVGLAPHKKISKEILDKVRSLGENLARKLMGMGAIEVMATAQAIIHGQQTAAVVSSS